MHTFLPLTIAGLVTGGIYAITASGLVVTYVTSGVFNFAHGAIGMLSAYLYWQLVVGWHLPTALSLALVTLGFAPLIGAVIERSLMRHLRGSPPEVAMVVTIGLWLAMLGLVPLIWDPGAFRAVPAFFTGRSVHLFGVYVTYHELIVLAAVVVVALTLRLFLYRTRVGVAMRAVVDNPDLTALAGANPGCLGQYGWVLGSVLAALAGILVAPIVTLDSETLTLLMVYGYAAATLGRLKNLPLTFVGGLLVGLGINYAIGYLPNSAIVSQSSAAVPIAFLFVTLLAFPPRSLKVARPLSDVLLVPKIVSLPRIGMTSAIFVTVIALLAAQLSTANVFTMNHGLAFAIVGLSLVPLTGYAGQTSLCQFTFAGLGVWAAVQVGDGRSLLGFLAAAGLAAGVGMLVALPALRLQGLHLALATLAFAEFMDVEFFQNPNITGGTQSLWLKRPHLLGISFDDERRLSVLLAVTLALVGAGILLLRRSAFGRRLLALNDSPAACASLGINRVWARMVVFGLSAAIAGLGGALYGAQQKITTPADFAFLTSIVLLMLAYTIGIRSVAGILVTGIVFGLFPILQRHLPHGLQNFMFLLTGLGAIGFGINPNGLLGLPEVLAHHVRGRRVPGVGAPEPLALGQGVRGASK